MIHFISHSSTLSCPVKLCPEGSVCYFTNACSRSNSGSSHFSVRSRTMCVCTTSRLLPYPSVGVCSHDAPGAYPPSLTVAALVLFLQLGGSISLQALMSSHDARVFCYECTSPLISAIGQCLTQHWWIYSWVGWSLLFLWWWVVWNTPYLLECVLEAVKFDLFFQQYLQFI